MLSLAPLDRLEHKLVPPFWTTAGSFRCDVGDVSPTARYEKVHGICTALDVVGYEGEVVLVS